MTDEHYLLSKIADVQRRQFELGIERLKSWEQVFAAVWELEAEVNNGGFDQYFFNSSGGHASIAANGLKAIGAYAMAGLLERAIGMFGSKGPSSVHAQRQMQLAAASNQFEELDKEFWRYPENLSELLAAFVRKNAA